MSVKAMALVWDMNLPRDQKLVLLAYADHADHEGRSIFPSVALIARKTGYSDRSIQTITKELQAAGRLVLEGYGPHGTRCWRMPLYLAGEDSAPPPVDGQEAQPGAPRGEESGAGGAEINAGGEAAGSPEPSLEPSLEPREEPRSPSPNGKILCPRCGVPILPERVDVPCSGHGAPTADLIRMSHRAVGGR